MVTPYNGSFATFLLVLRNVFFIKTTNISCNKIRIFPWYLHYCLLKIILFITKFRSIFRNDLNFYKYKEYPPVGTRFLWVQDIRVDTLLVSLSRVMLTMSSQIATSTVAVSTRPLRRTERNHTERV